LRKDNAEGKFGEVYYLEGDYFWGRKSNLFGWWAEMDYYSIISGAAIQMIDFPIIIGPLLLHQLMNYLP
jgi:hypothetical protein